MKYLTNNTKCQFTYKGYIIKPGESFILNDDGTFVKDISDNGEALNNAVAELKEEIATLVDTTKTEINAKVDNKIKEVSDNLDKTRKSSLTEDDVRKIISESKSKSGGTLTCIIERPTCDTTVLCLNCSVINGISGDVFCKSNLSVVKDTMCGLKGTITGEQFLSCTALDEKITAPKTGTMVFTLKNTTRAPIVCQNCKIYNPMYLSTNTIKATKDDTDYRPQLTCYSGMNGTLGVSVAHNGLMEGMLTYGTSCVPEIVVPVDEGDVVCLSGHYFGGDICVEMK